MKFKNYVLFVVDASDVIAHLLKERLHVRNPQLRPAGQVVLQHPGSASRYLVDGRAPSLP